MRRLLASGQAGYGLAPGALWRHSVAVALGASGFADRFCAKGRFATMMAALPVKLITHPQPGLLGAAAAFAAEHLAKEHR